MLLQSLTRDSSNHLVSAYSLPHSLLTSTLYFLFSLSLSLSLIQQPSFLVSFDNFFLKLRIGGCTQLLLEILNHFSFPTNICYINNTIYNMLKVIKLVIEYYSITFEETNQYSYIFYYWHSLHLFAFIILFQFYFFNQKWIVTYYGPNFESSHWAN